MKVLIIEGGGVMGVIPAFLMAEVEDENDISDKWDAFGGTSVGSYMALGYASGQDPFSLLHLFLKYCPGIFKESFFRKINPFGPKYSDKVLNRSLKMMLPGKLGEIDKPVFVPSYNFQNNEVRIFDTFDEPEDYHTWEIARMSSAAPTFFAPYEGFIDGGLIANNPVLATVWGLKYKKGIPYEDMEVLIIGTGNTVFSTVNMSKVKWWSAVHWLKPMLNMLTEGNEQFADFGAKQMPFKKYRHFKGPEVPAEWKLDSVDKLDKILEMTTPLFDDFKRCYGEFTDE